MTVKDEIKADQQRIFNERMERRKKEEAENPTRINEKFGCGVALFIIILFAFIWTVNNWEDDNKRYDPSDWNFDGKVDIKDAEMKLDRILDNE